MPFTLHPTLEADSIFLRDLPLCQLRLQNQSAIPWLILVPRRENITEIYELPPTDRHQLMEEITQATTALQTLFKPDKLNIGALGNIVPQLHIHAIARSKADPAWPQPVWGKLGPNTYLPEILDKLRQRLNEENLWR